LYTEKCQEYAHYHDISTHFFKRAKETFSLGNSFIFNRRRSTSFM